MNIELITVTYDEIDQRIMKYMEKFKGYEINRRFLIRQIIKEFRKDGIMVSEKYIRNFIRKLESDGVIQSIGYFKIKL